ncbi:MAG: glycosyltransferase [Sphaerochaetaceae bacterium]|jgi:glycosyltransferase involved in cell wall biosynthesis
MIAMKRLKIGQFSETFPPFADGVGYVVKNYAQQLIQRGHKVTAVVSGSSIAEGAAYDADHHIDYTIRAPMLPFPKVKPYGPVMMNPQFRLQVRSCEFDLIHTHAPFFLAQLAEKAKRRSSVPLISTFHTLYRDDFYGFTRSDVISDLLVKNIISHYQNCDEVWTTTPFAAGKLHSYGYQGEITIMPNGCDFALPSSEEELSYRQKGLHFLQHNDAIPIIIYVGQLKAEKNIELIIRALAHLKAQKTKFRMVFVGTGADEHYYKKLSQELGLESHITFTGKIGDREKLKELLSAATLFVFPSQYDTSPLVMQEAAAFSLPLLNTANSSTALMTKEGFNGFISENNVDAYALKLQQLLNNRELCAHVGRNARSSLYRSWDQVLDEVELRYHTLVDKRKRP